MGGMASEIRLLRGDYLKGYRLETYERGKTPAYAVLSHTWSHDPDDEVTFSDIVASRDQGRHKKSSVKLSLCSQWASQDGLAFFWIDTCCIDKTDGEELQSSVSLMWQTYEKAAKCYAFLSDVSVLSSLDSAAPKSDCKRQLCESRWFTRGWTLQELLAPSEVEFRSREGICIGSRETLKKTVHRVTGISIKALEGQELSSFEIDERLSWAEGRTTSQEEDESYSLFGIFGVSMRLEYGEGRERARQRLTEVIKYQQSEPMLGTKVALASTDQKATLEWLSPLDHKRQQFDNFSRREEGTGTWFLQSAKYLAWTTGRTRTLLCHGVPGVGKTIIAATVINQLSTLRVPDISVAYIFYNYRTQASQSASLLLASLLRQLVERQSQLHEVVATLRKRHKMTDTRPRQDELFDILVKVCSGYRRTYIVIDALDECSDQYGARSNLIERLHSLQKEADVRLLFTTRPDPAIVSKTHANCILEIQSKEQDLEQFLKSRVRLMPSVVQQDESMRHMIVQTILSGAKGIFLLARLHSDAIVSMAPTSTSEDLRAALKKLTSRSASLDVAYGEALQRIDSQLSAHRLIGRKVLAWVAFSRRSLAVAELCDALATCKHDVEAVDSATVKIDQALATCAGLVVVDDLTKTVRLVHYTLQKHLERVRAVWMPEALPNLAETCLTYLNRNVRFMDPDLSLYRRTKRPFYDYCKEHWAAHAELARLQANNDNLEALNSMEALYMTAQVSYTANLPLYLKSHERSSLFESPDGFAQIYSENRIRIHARASLNEIVALITSISTVNKDMLLVDAARKGYLDVVERLLMRENIRVNSPDREGRTALSWAAAEGRDEIVERLLHHKDVVVGMTDKFGRSPLSYAAEQGHGDVVKRLIGRNDAAINQRDEAGWTPLLSAAANGHAEVVRILLKSKRIRVNREHKTYDRTPLALAAVHGHTQIVEMLLEREDVEIDVRDKFGRTSLLLAAAEGCTEVVRLFLKQSDVIPDQRDDAGQTPLSWAAAYGHQNVARLLLEREDVDAFSIDNKGRSPLSLAIAGHHKAVSQMLLEQQSITGLFNFMTGATICNTLSWLTGSCASNKGFHDFTSTMSRGSEGTVN